VSIATVLSVNYDIAKRIHAASSLDNRNLFSGMASGTTLAMNYQPPRSLNLTLTAAQRPRRNPAWPFTQKAQTTHPSHLCFLSAWGDVLIPVRT
jgi:hypothetical protein